MTTITEEEMLGRRLPLAGTYNVRDIGGYPTLGGRRTARGRLLRGDALHRLDDDGRRTLAEYGLRTSIDLREEEERRDAPDALPAEVRLVAIPIFSHVPDGVDPVDLPDIDRAAMRTLEEIYRALVRARGPVIVAALRELLRPGALPAIVHCTAGKDRTGIVVAMLLDVVGVPTEVIAADYAATAMFLTGTFVDGVRTRTVAAGYDPKLVAAMLQCEPQMISSLLGEVRAAHGDVARYLVHHGMEEDELARLRALIVEGADA